MTTLDCARRYLAAGFSVIPIKPDGSKSPAEKWKEFQKRLPTDQELSHWFGNGHAYGLAIVCGSVSGNLEVIDFDSKEAFELWSELVESECPGLLENIPRVRTPSGGVHVYLRRGGAVVGNRKLALDAAGRVLIETRGQGGYVLAPGCPSSCHPDGKEYVWERPLAE